MDKRNRVKVWVQEKAGLADCQIMKKSMNKQSWDSASYGKERTKRAVLAQQHGRQRQVDGGCYKGFNRASLQGKDEYLVTNRRLRFQKLKFFKSLLM